MSQAAIAMPRLDDARARLDAKDAAGAEKLLAAILAATPDDGAALHLMGIALVRLGRVADAAQMLERGAAAADDTARAGCLQELAKIHSGAGRHEAALDAFQQAQRLMPQLDGIDLQRAGEMELLHRDEDALAVLEDVLARNPGDMDAHYRYNSLLFRLQRDDIFCKSYETAGNTPAHRLAKAILLARVERLQEAHDLCAALVAEDPGNSKALLSLGVTLSGLERHAEAGAALEKAVAVEPGNADYLSQYAATLIRLGDPQKAADTAMRALSLDPFGQHHYAMLGTAWRMLKDPREDMLMGYFRLVRTFELEPPKGFADIESFNAELAAWLDDKHPKGREYFDQSLRGGTQTQGNLFNTRHPLLDALRERLVECVRRYIRELPAMPGHPFTDRRSTGFRFAGSWSSRLKNQGFHANHVHPAGWISSCYYIQVPGAVRDLTGHQGWIQFGQPSLDLGIAPRRVVQPAPGRLVLFPSYMWHGTVPFHDEAVRTTIAFDVLPT